MEDQTTFVILMGLCCAVGLLFTRTSSGRKLNDQKSSEDELASLLSKRQPFSKERKEREGGPDVD